MVLPFIAVEGTVVSPEAFECASADEAILRAEVNRKQRASFPLLPSAGQAIPTSFQDAVVLKKFGDVPTDLTLLF